MKKILITLLFAFVFSNLNGQAHFKYKVIPSKLRDMVIGQTLQSKDYMPSYKAEDLTKYLPKGYSKSGNVDYTHYLQEGLNENREVIFPDFPVLINYRGLKVKSNSTLFFREKSVLIVSPNDRPRYHAILIDGVKNVKVFYPKIIGDKYNHKNTDGQWGMGIWIKHSSQILIHGAEISRCWGDGIYIGNERNSSSEDITISNSILDDNRRNGLSITSGKNIQIRDILVSNTNGQNPRSGIDIEPNTNLDILENLIINNVITYNNAMHGIVVSLGGLIGTEEKHINLRIDGHRDYGSTIALGISQSKSNAINVYSPIKGNINICNSQYIDNRHASIKSYKGRSQSITLDIVNLTINNLETNQSGNKIRSLKNYFKRGQEIRIK